MALKTQLQQRSQPQQSNWLTDIEHAIAGFFGGGQPGQSQAQKPLSPLPPTPTPTPPPWLTNTYPGEMAWIDEQRKTEPDMTAGQLAKMFYDGYIANQRQQQQQKVLGAETTKNMTPLEQQTIDTFKQYRIHPAVAYGIANAEGGKIGKNNLWNINAVDSNPNLATNYSDTLSAASSAAKLMNGMLQKQGAVDKAPQDQLHAIENSGYAGDPTTWKQRSAATGGAGKTFNSWSDFVKSTPAWQKWASEGE